MVWWKQLYLGDLARVLGGRLKVQVEAGRAFPNVYVITPPASGNHLLDIRPALLLSEKERESEDFLILGLAVGHGEAKEVVRRMIADVYAAPNF